MCLEMLRLRPPPLLDMLDWSHMTAMLNGDLYYSRSLEPKLQSRYRRNLLQSQIKLNKQ